MGPAWRTQKDVGRILAKAVHMGSSRATNRQACAGILRFACRHLRQPGPGGVRHELFELIRGTPWLHWQLLTKRPQHLARYLPHDWWQTPNGYPNVWLGITAENQTEYNRRWPYLQVTLASVRFVSYEPALGSLDLTGYFNRVPDWVIWGGESGRGGRQMAPSWAAHITAQCERLNVAVFGKQWGHYRSNPLVHCDHLTHREAARLDPKSHGKGGALLNGRLYRQFPDPRP